MTYLTRSSLLKGPSNTTKKTNFGFGMYKNIYSSGTDPIHHFDGRKTMTKPAHPKLSKGINRMLTKDRKKITTESKSMLSRMRKECKDHKKDYKK